MPDFLLLIVSSLYIVFCICISYLLRSKKKISGEVSRKVIHILASNWYFIYLYFSSPIYPITGLVVVSIIVFLGIIKNFPQKIFGKNFYNRNWGLFYYPLSIILLIVFVNLGYLEKSSFGCGLLSMGYGDGLAAIFGLKYGKKTISKYSGEKTWIGTVIMFFVILIVCILLRGWNPLFIIVALIGTFTEALSPLGLDNISVPIVISFLVEFLC